MTRLLAAALAFLAGAAPAISAEPSLVVLELFTSQSCSSCPPADALLGRLRETAGGGLLPLSLHVDYWNRIGWVDRYSSREFTRRQYGYGGVRGQAGVYTPELVVDGAEGVVGSDADAVAEAIARARRARAARPAIRLDVARQGGRLVVDVGAGEGRGRVLLFGYDDRHVTQVGSGENAGRTLTEVNVVRALVPLGAWAGAPLALQADLPAGEHAAVLLQAEDGQVLAARVAG